MPNLLLWRSYRLITAMYSLYWFQRFPFTAVKGKLHSRAPFDLERNPSYVSSLSTTEDWKVTGYLELYTAKKHFMLTGTDWTNSSAIAVTDLGVVDTRLGRIEDQAGHVLNPTVAFMYVQTRG